MLWLSKTTASPYRESVGLKLRSVRTSSGCCKGCAIATFSFVPITGVVWVHHMFASGTPGWMRTLFMFTTELVAVSSGVKVFAWTATIWRSKLHLDTPLLFAISGVIMFVLAGVTGVMLGALPFDLHVNNTYFIVGHFHYLVFNTIVMAYFAAIYYWFPKVTGRMYSQGWGKLHFGLVFVGANLNFFPMFPLGLQGMLRRVSSYDPQYANWNVAASLGAFLVGVSMLPFIANMIVHDESPVDLQRLRDRLFLHGHLLSHR